MYEFEDVVKGLQDTNGVLPEHTMLILKMKLQMIKSRIRKWLGVQRITQSSVKLALQNKIKDYDQHISGVNNTSRVLIYSYLYNLSYSWK